MQVAQRLYEGMEIGGETTGLITYMRTDGVQMAPEAIERCPPVDRQGVRRQATCRKSPLSIPAKAKNAQEAHEAIRPTDSFDRTPAR
jgi:DNA topoisomerase-1